MPLEVARQLEGASRVQVAFAGISLAWTLLLASPLVFELSTRYATLVVALALLPAIPLLLRRRRRHFRAAAGLAVLAYLALTPVLVFYMYLLLPPVVLLGLCAAEPTIPRRRSLLTALVLVLGLIACSAVALVLPGLL